MRACQLRLWRRLLGPLWHRCRPTHLLAGVRPRRIRGRRRCRVLQLGLLPLVLGLPVGLRCLHVLWLDRVPSARASVGGCMPAAAGLVLEAGNFSGVAMDLHTPTRHTSSCRLTLAPPLLPLVMAFFLHPTSPARCCASVFESVLDSHLLCLSPTRAFLVSL